MTKVTEKKRSERTCVACGASDRKGTLSRIVREPEGGASFDPTGRKAGRGAYVCNADCFAAARKTDKLSRALRCKVSDEDYERIASDLMAASLSPME